MFTQEDLSAAENTKRAIFDILMTITLEVNMITRQMNPFFYLLFELYPLFHLTFTFQDLQNSISWVPHFPSVLVCKIRIYLPMMTT